MGCQLKAVTDVIFLHGKRRLCTLKLPCLSKNSILPDFMGLVYPIKQVDRYSFNNSTVNFYGLKLKILERIGLKITRD